MPVVRVSNQLWKEITEVSGRDGVSLTYALDKILDGLRGEQEELLNQLDSMPLTIKDQMQKDGWVKNPKPTVKTVEKVVEKTIKPKVKAADFDRVAFKFGVKDADAFGKALKHLFDFDIDFKKS